MNKQKVAIALSGGVDSSVAASILQNQGYEVIAITMLVCPLAIGRNDGEAYIPSIGDIKLWVKNYLNYEPSEDREIESAARRLEIPPEMFEDPLNSIGEAARTSEILGIEHHIVDLRDEFKECIIDYFADEYYSGKTPNPCTKCNPLIKFGKLLDIALDLGADYFATGHYARVYKNENTGLYELQRGKDDTKDQAYALYGLTQRQLSHIVFPLGEMTKKSVKESSKSLNLSLHEKPESQEICFIPDDDYIKFLKERYGSMDKPGPIIHKNGEKLGEHKGLIHYTVGQRRRLGIAHPKPLYVMKIDAKNNTLIVGYQEDMLQDYALAGDLKWISGEPPVEGRVMVKIRYNQKEVPAVIEFLQGEQDEKATVKIKFDNPVRAVTPGQSAVFLSYEDPSVVLGGGILLQA